MTVPYRFTCAHDCGLVIACTYMHVRVPYTYAGPQLQQMSVFMHRFPDFLLSGMESPLLFTSCHYMNCRYFRTYLYTNITKMRWAREKCSNKGNVTISNVAISGIHCISTYRIHTHISGRAYI